MGWIHPSSILLFTSGNWMAMQAVTTAQTSKHFSSPTRKSQKRPVHSCCAVPPYHWTGHQHCFCGKPCLWTLWQKNNVCYYVNRKIEILWIRESPALLELLGCSRKQWVSWFITWLPFQVYSLWCICREQCREPPSTSTSLTYKANLF